VTATLAATLAATGVAALAVTAAGPALAAGRGAPAAPADRGQLVSVTPLGTLPTQAAVRAELTADGFSAAPARYGVRSYRLIYRTVDAHGRPTTASGLMVLPVNGPRRLPVVSFTHGTEVYRGDAPSMQPTGFEPDPAYTYASAGFAVADPDYLGLGTGPGLQPWMDVPSETTAALDMLRAVRGYLVSHGRTVRRDVMVTGFSQGASPALGLGRALQDRADPSFRLGALAAVSGAYDFAGAELPAVLNGDLIRLNPDPQLGAKYTVLYTVLTLVAFDRVHRIYNSPADVFRAPYAATITGLLDGNHTGPQVLGGTPDTLAALLTPGGFALLKHPSGPFAAALTANDSVCVNWAPAGPTRLYLATGDEQAVNANTLHCQASFAAHGTRVPVVNLGTPDDQDSRHLGSNVAATPQIAAWFARLAR
jgi:dienelactone hydrolase